VAGFGEGVGRVIAGLGVAGMTIEGVGKDVGVAVGDGEEETVGDGRLTVDASEAAGLGRVAGALQAETRARISNAAIGVWRNM
jgi:hypothetical protein